MYVFAARCVDFSASHEGQGELMLLTGDYNIYHMPCGDLCTTTCLDQAEEVPAYEVHINALNACTYHI